MAITSGERVAFARQLKAEGFTPARRYKLRPCYSCRSKREVLGVYDGDVLALGCLRCGRFGIMHRSFARRGRDGRPCGGGRG